MGATCRLTVERGLAPGPLAALRLELDAAVADGVGGAAMYAVAERVREWLQVRRRGGSLG